MCVSLCFSFGNFSDPRFLIFPNSLVMFFDSRREVV
jgi:hypothetical protein